MSNQPNTMDDLQEIENTFIEADCVFDIKGRSIEVQDPHKLYKAIQAKIKEVELRADKNRVAETLADLDIRGLDGTKKRLEWLLNDLNDRQSLASLKGGDV